MTTLDATQQAIDPVCGMTVNPATARGGSIAHAGTTYYFCSTGCHDKFAKDPARYVNRDAGTNSAASSAPHPAPNTPHLAPSATPVVSGSTDWTCPMHPQVVRNAPGDCPICGMAL